jgi:hypothetical protein
MIWSGGAGAFLPGGDYLCVAPPTVAGISPAPRPTAGENTVTISECA